MDCLEKYKKGPDAELKFKSVQDINRESSCGQQNSRIYFNI